MTRQQIKEMVESFKLPYSYYQFPEGTAQEPPYVVFFHSSSDDLYADVSNYQRIETLNIELYTHIKDFAQEDAIEAVLAEYGLTYYKEQSHIDSEDLWQTAYEMEVLING